MPVKFQQIFNDVRYSRRIALRLLIILFLGLRGSIALGLGLGDISSNSYLGEPLEARISLVGTEGVSKEDLIVSLLSEAEAESLGFDVINSPTRIQFKLIESGSNIGHVQLKTARNIVEPVINFVVRLVWPGGVVVREYSLFFDAPNIGYSTQTSPPKASENINSSFVSAEPLRKYRVNPGDTVSGIAAKMQLPRGVSLDAAIKAVMNKNPRAFLSSNPNSLMAGVVLNLPFDTDSWSESVSAPNAIAQNDKPSDGPEGGAVTNSEKLPQRLGQLHLSQPVVASDAANYDAPQIKAKIEGTQEMLDLLVKENKELRDRIERIESSEYLTTLTQLVAMQRKQMDDLQTEFRSALNNRPLSLKPADTKLESRPNTNKEVGAALTLEGALAANFWLFMLMIFLSFAAVLAVSLWFVFRLKAQANRNHETPLNQPNINDSLDQKFVLPNADLKSIEPDPASNRVSVSQQGKSNNSRKGVQNTAKLHVEKQRVDREVKARILQKTEVYNSDPQSGQAPAHINQIELNVLVGLDEEINELLSMAHVYCSAGKYSEARAILTAQQQVESDPRLSEALKNIDKIEGRDK